MNEKLEKMLDEISMNLSLKNFVGDEIAEGARELLKKITVDFPRELWVENSRFYFYKCCLDYEISDDKEFAQYMPDIAENSSFKKAKIFGARDKDSIFFRIKSIERDYDLKQTKATIQAMILGAGKPQKDEDERKAAEAAEAARLEAEMKEHARIEAEAAEKERQRQEQELIALAKKTSESSEIYGNGYFSHYKGYDRRVVIPNGITVIGSYGFTRNDNIKEVIMPSSVTEIEYEAFFNCNSLESVTFSSNLKSIGSSAFEGCRSLKKVILPDGLKVLEIAAFKYCSSLKSVLVPGTVSCISLSAFSECHSLKEVIIANGVKMIEPYAFSWCESLENVIFPDSVTEIQSEAFKYASSLKYIEVSKDCYVSCDACPSSKVRRRS